MKVWVVALVLVYQDALHGSARDRVAVGVNHTVLHQEYLLITGSLNLQTSTHLGRLLEVVNLTSEHDREHRHDFLLQEHRGLTSGVDLASEDGGTVLVLGTQGGNTLNDRFELGTKRCADRSHTGGDLSLQTSLDVLGNLSPEGTNKSTLALDLGGSNPVAGVVTGKVTDSTVWRKRGVLSGEGGLDTHSKLLGQGLQQGANGNTGESTGQVQGVQGLEVDGKVVGVVVLLQLAHGRLAVSNLQSHLGDIVFVPAVVDLTRNGELVVDVTLGEHVFTGVQSRECIRGQVAANGEGVGGLESWVEREGLVQVGTQTLKEVLVQEDVTVNLLGKVLHGTWVGQTQGLSVLGDVGVDVVQVGEDGVGRPETVLLWQLRSSRWKRGHGHLGDVGQRLGDLLFRHYVGGFAGDLVSLSRKI